MRVEKALHPLHRWASSIKGATISATYPLQRRYTFECQRTNKTISPRWPVQSVGRALRCPPGQHRERGVSYIVLPHTVCAPYKIPGNKEVWANKRTSGLSWNGLFWPKKVEKGRITRTGAMVILALTGFDHRGKTRPSHDSPGSAEMPGNRPNGAEHRGRPL